MSKQSVKSQIIAKSAAHFGKSKRILVVSCRPEEMRAAILREAGGAWPIGVKVRPLHDRGSSPDG